jgi:hypothetical protein
MNSAAMNVAAYGTRSSFMIRCIRLAICSDCSGVTTSKGTPLSKVRNFLVQRFDTSASGNRSGGRQNLRSVGRFHEIDEQRRGVRMGRVGVDTDRGVDMRARGVGENQRRRTTLFLYTAENS